MPLLDRNGKPYKTFSEPNPLVKEQIELSKDKLIFYNFLWEPVVVETIRKKPTQKPQTVERPIVGLVEETFPTKESSPAKEKSEQVSDFLDLLKKEATSIKNTKPPVKEEVVIAQEVDPMDAESVVIVHCHPAIIRETTDSFYGETKRTIQYGKKFDIEAIIVERNDLEICLFAKQSLDRGSILYPSKYKDGEPLEMFRWWSVSRSETIKDGFMIFGTITEKQRDFSD